MKNADKPINPIVSEDGYPMDSTEVINEGNPDLQLIGLTKREYFAGLAMQGFLSNPELCKEELQFIATDSIEIADKLLEQLDQ